MSGPSRTSFFVRVLSSLDADDSLLEQEDPLQVFGTECVISRVGRARREGKLRILSRRDLRRDSD